MQGQRLLNYQQFKSSLQKSNYSSKSDQQALLHELSRIQQQNQYYKKRYMQMKSINESIITAIKRVYSEQLGLELQKILESTQQIFEENGGPSHGNKLTNTFCQLMISHPSKMITEKSIEKNENSFGTPQKINISNEISYLRSSTKINATPFLQKSHIKKTFFKQSRLKQDSGEVSTRRSSTPLRTNIATQIYCQLCQMVYLPNEFVTHVENCKYELSYIDSIQEKKDGGKQSRSINYEKMMRNLIKIRQEIEEQIKLTSYVKEEADHKNLKKKLEKDLKKIMKIISQKQAQIISKKKCLQTNKSSLRVSCKKMNKLK